jgi:predicted nucleic acid-binding protein
VRRTVLADTGPLYAAVDPDDQYHQRAQGELARLRDDGWSIAITYPTLLEAYTLVIQRLGIASAHQWLDEIAASAVLVLPIADDYASAIRRVRAYADQRLTLTDLVLATIGLRLAAPVWTYDHHFDLLQAVIWR